MKFSGAQPGAFVAGTVSVPPPSTSAVVSST
jgi:hypothetical protein